MKTVNMKKKIKIALIVFGAIVFVWYGFVVAVKYKNWKWVEGMKNEAAKFEKEIADKRAKIMADTYGGKTPQETLEMFIAAVEKGDYELASKYFVVEKRGEELERITSVKKENIDFMLQTIKETKNSNGYFSSDKKIFTIKKPIFIEFILYPSTLWKINEI